MAQTGKRRSRRIYTLHNPAKGGLWEAWRVEERFEAMMESDAVLKLRRGLPQLAMGILASQGRLVGGSAPFAPALLAAMMMRGGAVGWLAAGCAMGAVIAWEPQVLLTCAVLYVLHLCMRSAGLRPNDLSCVLALGLCTGALPQLFAENAYERLMAGLGAVAAMVLAKMFVPALRMRLRERELFSAEERIGAALLAACMLVGLRGIVLWGMRPAHAAMMLLSIASGYVGGAGMGAAAGVLVGLLAGVTEPAAPQLLGGLVLMGLLSGMLGKMGRLWSAASAPMAALLAAAMEPDFLSWAHAAELAAAVIGFACIRESAWQRVRGHVDKEAQRRAAVELTQEGLREALCGKIREYAGLYGRMARSLGADGGQYAAVGGALERLADETEQPTEALPETAQEVAQALDAAGVKAGEVQACRENGRLCIRLGLMCRKRDGLCDGRVIQAASRAVGTALRVRPTGFCPKEGLCRLELEEASRYELSVGWASGAKEDGEPCGDTMTAVQLPQGRYLLALADGMGHGADAREESRAAMELMEDFLLARFEPEAALHAVNEMMLKRSGGERFSTMDLALADLDTGNLRVMKIGAIPSYIRRGKRIIRVGGDALPMGIVERVTPSVTQVQLQDGDVLMMLSDGVLDAVDGDESWLHAQLLGADVRAMDAAARRIMEAARQVGRHRDDMTVCVARVMGRTGRG